MSCAREERWATAEELKGPYTGAINDIKDTRHCLEVSMTGEIPFKTIKASYGYWTVTKDRRDHDVPKAFQKAFEKDEARMLVWNIKAEIVEEDSAILWKGRYSVWYRSDLEGPFFFMKHYNPSPGQPWAKAGHVQYQDIKGWWGKPPWFEGEMVKIRKAIGGNK